MPSRTVDESIKIREMIEAALDNGAASPTQVLEWIEQRKDKSFDAPSLPTISRIMKDKGYRPAGKDWDRKK